MTEKVDVTFTFRRAGVAPPVFVVGDFSDPQWEPIEMEAAQGEDGEHVFTKGYQLEEGRVVHYKYRLGYDNWIHDDTADTGKRKSIFFPSSQPPHHQQASWTAHS
jgi:hypothetical protein